MQVAGAVDGGDTTGLGPVVPIHISKLEYVWAKSPGTTHPEIVGWYLEFETFMRDGKFEAVPTAPSANSKNLQEQLWRSVKSLHRDIVSEMKRKGSSCIVDGMRNALQVIQVPTGYLPRIGNQRLCVLRAANFGNPDCSCHKGMVPCVVLPK